MMNANGIGELSPKEKELLMQLEEIGQLANSISERLVLSEKKLSERENELIALRHKMIELKSENQHLKEVLQAWRERMESVLNQMKTIN